MANDIELKSVGGAATQEKEEKKCGCGCNGNAEVAKVGEEKKCDCHNHKRKITNVIVFLALPIVVSLIWLAWKKGWFSIIANKVRGIFESKTTTVDNVTN